MTETPTKTRTRCGLSFPRTGEHFGWNYSGSRNGLTGRCRTCIRNYTAARAARLAEESHDV